MQDVEAFSDGIPLCAPFWSVARAAKTSLDKAVRGLMPLLLSGVVSELADTPVMTKVIAAQPTLSDVLVSKFVSAK
jgi:hypothetical protein